MSSESWHAWFRFYVGRSILKITDWKLSKNRNCKIHCELLQKHGIGIRIEICRYEYYFRYSREQNRIAFDNIFYIFIIKSYKDGQLQKYLDSR